KVRVPLRRAGIPHGGSLANDGPPRATRALLVASRRSRLSRFALARVQPSQFADQLDAPESTAQNVTEFHQRLVVSRLGLQDEVPDLLPTQLEGLYPQVGRLARLQKAVRHDVTDGERSRRVAKNDVTRARLQYHPRVGQARRVAAQQHASRV